MKLMGFANIQVSDAPSMGRFVVGFPNSNIIRHEQQWTSDNPPFRMTISLLILPDEFGLYQFDRNHKLPVETLNQLSWYTVSKTTSELSLLCPAHEGTVGEAAKKKELGWRCFQVDAQMDFGLVGILASIIDPLRDNNVPVFVVSTFDTDYVLVKEDTLEKAIGVLNRQNDIVLRPGSSVIAGH